MIDLVKVEVDPPVVFTFLFNFTDTNTPDFAGAGNMCTATGLEVNTTNFYQAYLPITHGWCDRHSSYQFHVSTHFVIADPSERNLVIFKN